MKIAILHLSDIHFRRERESNSIFERTEQIAAAFRGLSEPRIDACFVAVTGDIAYSGNSQEYSVALDFFRHCGKQWLSFLLAQINSSLSLGTMIANLANKTAFAKRSFETQSEAVATLLKLTKR